MKNEVKNAIRHLVTKAYETFAANKSDLSVVSLPGTAWEFETNVFNHKDFAENFGKSYNLDMLLCECDKNIYNSNLRPLSTLLPHNKVSSYIIGRGNVVYLNQFLNADIVKKAKSNNIFAWFDFCGNPTTENLYIANTAAGKNVTYIFTFNTHWRCDSNVDNDLLIYTKSLDGSRGKAIGISIFLASIANDLGLTVVWNFEYVSNHNPMITVCLSNDANVIANASLHIQYINSSNKKINFVKHNKVTKNNTVKRDLDAVYVDVKAKMDDKSICAKHNISTGTLAAVKAWITMGK